MPTDPTAAQPAQQLKKSCLQEATYVWRVGTVRVDALPFVLPSEQPVVGHEHLVNVVRRFGGSLGQLKDVAHLVVDPPHQVVIQEQVRSCRIHLPHNLVYRDSGDDTEEDARKWARLCSARTYGDPTASKKKRARSRDALLRPDHCAREESTWQLWSRGIQMRARTDPQPHTNEKQLNTHHYQQQHNNNNINNNNRSVSQGTRDDSVGGLGWLSSPPPTHLPPSPARYSLPGRPATPTAKTAFPPTPPPTSATPPSGQARRPCKPRRPTR